MPDAPRYTIGVDPAWFGHAEATSVVLLDRNTGEAQDVTYEILKNRSSVEFVPGAQSINFSLKFDWPPTLWQRLMVEDDA